MLRTISLLLSMIVLSGCAVSPQPVLPSKPDQYGCTPPDPSTFTKLGVDLQFAQSTFGKVVTGDINIKTDPQVVDLIGKAAREYSIRDYLRCLAIKRDGYTTDQAAYLDRFNGFVQTSPSADLFIKWQQDNPFPKRIIRKQAEVTACSHLSVTAEWQGLNAPEQKLTCTYAPTPHCRILHTSTEVHSDSNASHQTAVNSDGKLLTSTVTARPHGSPIDRKRGWIDVSVKAILECEEQV